MTRRTLNTIAAASVAAMVGAPAFAQEPPIVVGVLTPLSGVFAAIGEQVSWGMTMAADEINADGGILGRQIRLVFEDSEGIPATAVQRAERMFDVEQVDLLTGTVNSGATLAVGQIAERADRILVTSVSFADSITGTLCSPNVFRVNARAGQQSAALAVWLAEEFPGARVYYLGPDYEMGRSTVAAFRANAERVGANSVGEIFTPLDSMDFSQFFGAIRSARPEVLYTSVAGNDTVRFFTQLEDFGIRQQLTLVGASGTLTSANIEATGTAAEGFVTGVGYSTEIPSDVNQEFVAAFTERFGAGPDLYGADSYGVLHMYRAAVEEAGTTDTAGVREALRDLSWETPQGTKTIRAGDHQAMQPMYVVQVTDGRFTIINEISAEDAIGEDLCERF